MRPERTVVGGYGNKERCLWPFWLCNLRVINRGNCGTHSGIWYEMIAKNETTDEELVACGWMLPLKRNARTLALEGIRAARRLHVSTNK